MIAIFVILLGILMINYWLTKTAEGLTISAVGKYDYSMSCENLDLIYNKATLQKLAADEYHNFYNNKAYLQGRKMSSTLSCFCNRYLKELGGDKNAYFKTSFGDKVPSCARF
jgi:hypothetical protein